MYFDLNSYFLILKTNYSAILISDKDLNARNSTSTLLFQPVRKRMENGTGLKRI